MSRSARIPILMLALMVFLMATSPPPDVEVRGRVVDQEGRPVAGAVVTARNQTANLAVSITTDTSGRYEFADLPPAKYSFEVRKAGSVADIVEMDLGPSAELELALTLRAQSELADPAPSSMFLSLLPDGETKRRFKLDCTGCHQFDEKIILKDGQLKSREDWVQRTDQMLAFAGAHTSFPIMSPSREAEATADWMIENLGGPGDPLPTMSPPSGLDDVFGSAMITEYDVPVPGDLPHDVMVAPDGDIIVTGMFTHQLYVLNAATGEFTTEVIPVESANPRAVDHDASGAWWVLLGAPQRMARFDPASSDWQSWELGMYPHSIAVDGAGRLWYNGHFTKEPELIGYLDPETGTTETFEVPTEPMADGGSTIPYGLRVAPDGTIWATQLIGGQLIRFSPGDESFKLYRLPTSFSGPRRPDVGPDGIVWIPEYAGNKLAKFDPETERFTEYDFPIPDALPYVVRVDQKRGTVWIGTSAADAVVRFDPRSERFTVYPLPTRGALTRHIDIDEQTGAVWGAYSPAPVVHARVFKLEAR